MCIRDRPYPARENKCTINVFNMHNNLNKSCHSIFTNALVSRSSFAPSTTSYLQPIASRSRARQTLNLIRPTRSRSSLKERKRTQKLSTSISTAQKDWLHDAHLKIHHNILGNQESHGERNNSFPSKNIKETERNPKPGRNRTEVKTTTTREKYIEILGNTCLLYTSPSPRDRQKSRMPSSA